MRRAMASGIALAVIASSCAPSRRSEPATSTLDRAERRLSPEDIRHVAPALERYRQDLVGGSLWKRPGLSRRDRSIVTVAALIARNQPLAMTDQFTLALDNGVRPGELSEVITHLAFYSGWGNAISAVAIAKDVFATRNIDAAQLPAASGELQPSTKRPRRSARPVWRRTSVRYRPESWNTQGTCCSANCGCGPAWRRATGVW